MISRAEQINTLRAENEAKVLAKEELHKKQWQAVRATQARNAFLKDKARQLREASKGAVLESKRHLVREGREEQMKLQQQKQEKWIRDIGLNTSRAKVIRSQRDNARKRMEEEKLRKLENTRIEYENKVQQEESIRARTEALVSAMEKEEMELIQVG
ncbi:NBP2b protein, putative [Perkinsus marinus ATCC 50983]|uniref:NBP2b protein, putative n=1 Tax=Perkinsus marinus (strain ATCC 50983 / TXsc) TaxID=423536 RepID=C5KR49_PERM5|nr:NBP2b protein, putative [Perkinsus marinus ATCC 50983]XP_002781249.1 NBP2b protein, putative [Perkinsus marinus ATCC 50983]EER11757.1 NBP2b protein, putative [Perkinsus marinus ATCC 50983]EER13044.1 NBP2b protein, putative [Perkinsus marinus ATCC 50983]|eukprot:XP_002779962.1 NBP2b protein, putative [Perkinsus marinus ATCC 50983]